MLFTKKSKNQINDNFSKIFYDNQKITERLDKIESLLIRRGYGAEIGVKDDNK